MRKESAAKTSDWRRLVDTYLNWAHHTRFRYFGPPLGRFGILVELATALDAPQRKRLENAKIFVAQSYTGERFITAEIDLADRQAQLEAFAEIGALRMELATPVAAPRTPNIAPLRAGPQPYTRLVGVIDDGCPFAHADLRVNGRSRVAFLWDQGTESPAGNSGQSNSAYGYGNNFDSSALEGAIKLGTPALASSPDEDSVYELAGQKRLRPLATHGAHVLGLAAASTPARNRISPSRFVSSDATEPPSWKSTANIDAAIGFVQIPKAALDDSSGRWLGRYVLDGIHALIDYAVAVKTIKRVTINVSYGPQTGPHDGSSLLESAIDDLVASVRNGLKPIDELFVVLPVGNSYQSRAHAEFYLERGGGPVTWHVPPDSETPAFLEIWLPRGMSLSRARVTVSSPDGLSLTAAAGNIVQSPDGSWHLVATNTAVAGGRAQWMVLVALGPTGGYARLAQPPHGSWTVSVKPARRNIAGCVHAYIARNDYNFGGLRRGKPSHFWLESYDPDRFMRSREDDLPVPPNSALPGVRICSAGSISGLATGDRSNVAAGYRIADGEPATYSSGGPSRGKREGPDLAYPTDESRVFGGINSWGTRSGASVRLMGTSSATPQYARDIDIGGNAALPPTGPLLDPRLGSGRK